MHKTITVKRQGNGVVLLHMIRESDLNTLSIPLLDELIASLDALRWDPDCRVLVVSGQGRVFSAGAELSIVRERDPISIRSYLEKTIEAMDKLEDMPQPTIAAINGVALGGGCELALACDFRIMVETAKLGVPEVGLGVLPGAGGIQRLTHLIGKARATEMVLLGRHLSAEESERFGLLYRRVPDDALMDEAMLLAEELLQKSPVAMHLAKRCLRAACDTDRDTANHGALDAISLCAASKDLQEGLQAFFEERRPEFPGFGAHLSGV